MSRLDELVAAAREHVRRAREQVPLEHLRSQLPAGRGNRPFKEALTRPGLSVIAEFKRHSPSAGEISPGAAVADLAAAYERGGAAAMSVLTEQSSFHGSITDLSEARRVTELPILRKDFIVDVYQLWEAAAAGADAVLLIVAALSDDELLRLFDEASALDLDCLVEVHDEEEVQRALEVDPEVIGVNNRNLKTFEVDLDRCPELMADIPAGKAVVAESGYSTREDLVELERIGADAVLVGETLMRAADPEALLRHLTADEEATREHHL